MDGETNMYGIEKKNWFRRLWSRFVWFKSEIPEGTCEHNNDV